MFLVALVCLCALVPVAGANSFYTWNFASTPNGSMGTSVYTYTSAGLSISAVPEPSGLFLMGTGLILVATSVRRELRA